MPETLEELRVRLDALTAQVAALTTLVRTLDPPARPIQPAPEDHDSIPGTAPAHPITPRGRPRQRCSGGRAAGALPPRQQQVLLALAQIGGECSFMELLEWTEIAKATLNYSLRRLRELGLVTAPSARGGLYEITELARLGAQFTPVEAPVVGATATALAERAVGESATASLAPVQSHPSSVSDSSELVQSHSSSVEPGHDNTELAHQDAVVPPPSRASAHAPARHALAHARGVSLASSETPEHVRVRNQNPDRMYMREAAGGSGPTSEREHGQDMDADAPSLFLLSSKGKRLPLPDLDGTPRGEVGVGGGGVFPHSDAENAKTDKARFCVGVALAESAAGADDWAALLGGRAAQSHGERLDPYWRDTWHHTVAQAGWEVSCAD